MKVNKLYPTDTGELIFVEFEVIWSFGWFTYGKLVRTRLMSTGKIENIENGRNSLLFRASPWSLEEV